MRQEWTLTATRTKPRTRPINIVSTPSTTPPPKADSELGGHDPAAARLGQERRGHGLVPVLTGDDEHAEHEGQQPRVVEHREDVGEPLRRAVGDDPGVATVAAAGGEGEGEPECEVDHHDDPEEDVGRPDRPELADLGASNRIIASPDGPTGGAGARWSASTTCR